MVKHAQTICRLLPTNCLTVFDYLVGLALKGLTKLDEYDSVILIPFIIISLHIYKNITIIDFLLIIITIVNIIIIIII